MLRDLEEYLADSGLLASRLKLGEWIATSFGTAMIEKRRASERRLPKSVPPPRSSERVRAGAALPSSAAIPAAARVPRPHELPVSDGAMRAFKKELESGSRVSMEPGSLAGAAMDVAPSSSATVLDPTATGRGRAGIADDSAGPAAPLAAVSATTPAAVAKTKNPAAAAATVAVSLAIVAALVALARFFVQ
jgi:hypothetical protein